MNARADSLSKNLVAGVLVLTLMVLALGGAVVAVKLRPHPIPTDSVNRQIALWQGSGETAPSDARAHTGLGLAYLGAQRSEEAKSEFQRAVELDQTSWLASFQLALLVKTEYPAEAEALLNQAAKYASGQDRSAPLVALGELLMANGDAKGSAEAYRKSIGIDPFTFDAHFGLGQALGQLGQTEAAIAEFHEAQRFDPSNQAVADAIEQLRNG